MSLALTGVSFDGGTATGWQGIGFNLDGLCTTASSTDVCTQQTGAPKTAQDDGTGGIDNSFGGNVCPVLESTSGPGACSSAIMQAYVTTDVTGSGTLAIPVNGTWMEFPIHDAFVTTSGTAGVLAAVAPTAGVVRGMQAVAGHVSASLCSGSAFSAIQASIEQASDILSDGSNAAGPACDAISIGLTFSGSSPYSGPFPVVDNPCIADASTD